MKPYTIRKSKRAKYLRLAVYPDGRVVLTVPHWLGGGVIERFFAERAEWVREKLEFFRSAPRTKQPRSREDYRARKGEARALVEGRIAHYAACYGLTVRAISIRQQKTRWGSCSRRGNISINYRILDLPSELQDYLVVHELCHLREMNHSPRFWALVAETIPDYREQKYALRQHERSLL